MERFRRAFERFEKALGRFEEVAGNRMLEGMFSKEFLIEILTKRFEYTYEALWKCTKEFLRERGIECNSPRSCFENLIREGIISRDYERILADMIKTRNSLVHIYDPEMAESLVEKIRSEEYITTLRYIYSSMKNFCN